MSRRPPGIVPSGLVEGGICLLPPPQPVQRQPQAVVGLTISWVGISSGEARHSCAEVRLCSWQFTPAQVPQPQGVVAAAVAGVSGQGLPPVQAGVSGGVAVLL